MTETTPPTSTAMWMHLSPLIAALIATFTVGVPLIGILVPLLFWQLKKNEHPFLDDQGREVVRFQVMFTVYGFILTCIAVGLTLLLASPALAGVSTPLDADYGGLAALSLMGTIGVVLLNLPLLLMWVIFPIIAAVKARKGVAYRYPLVFSPRKRAATTG